MGTPRTKSPNLIAAFNAGWRAYMDGESLDACPYNGKGCRRRDGAWGGVFSSYWIRGWSAAQHEMEHGNA